MVTKTIAPNDRDALLRGTKLSPLRPQKAHLGRWFVQWLLIVCRGMQMFGAVLSFIICDLYLGVGLSYSHSHLGKAEITFGDDITLVIGYPEELASFIEWGSMK